MKTNVLIVSNELLEDLFSQVAQSKDLHFNYYQSIELIGNKEFRTTNTICVLLPNQNIEQTLYSIKNLRLKHRFCGAIITLSFLPKEYLLTQKESEFLTTQGCFYLQVPFLLEELLKLLIEPIKLSKEKLVIICQQLSAQPVFEMVSRLRHDWDNKFNLILGHLLQLEKFSYFTNLDLNKILKEVNKINELLTLQKVDEIYINIAQLVKLLASWKTDINSYQEIFNNGFTTIRAWLDLINRLKAENTNEMLINNVFRLAKQLHQAIKQMLETLTAIKQEAGKVE